MKKLALNPEELCVQSFATADGRAAAQAYATDPIGTGETEPDLCFTCEETCGSHC